MAHCLVDGPGLAQVREQAGKGLVLGVFEGVMFQAFELDSHAVVVAIVAALPRGFARVPGTLVDADELNQLAIPPDEKVRRHFGAANLVEVGVRVPVERVGEESLDFVAAVDARRQAD